MKDEYKRRRKLERPLIRTLPDVESGDVFSAGHQECLNLDCGFVSDITTQGQEFVAVSSDDWWLEVYELCDEESSASFDLGSASGRSDDTVVPTKTKNALWRAVPRDPALKLFGNITFLAPDVLGLVQLETRPATVSTWNARSGQYLERIALRGHYFCETICEISDTEFIVGGEHGHLFSFKHEGGHNLRETRRVWQAHADLISTISFHNSTIVTTSRDWTARVWDAETKQRLAVLYHDERVFSAAISDQHVVTCSRYSRSHWEDSELRMYRNGAGYPLVKILRTHEGLFAPTLLDDGRVLCLQRGERDDNGRPLVRDALLVVDFENELIAAHLKVGCRDITKFEVLPDGRLFVYGHRGCRVTITKLPRKLARLICPKATEKQVEIGTRRLCTIV